MKRFLCRFFVFLIPFICFGSIAAPFFFIGIQTGELQSFDKLMEKQRDDHSIFIGMGYNEQTGYYKLKNANFYQAEVIVLGTSRVMQFQANCFSGSFYNCGGGVGENYDEYLNFLKNLDYTPNVILLGLDAWTFNNAWNKSCPLIDKYKPVMLIERNKLSIIWNIMVDFVNHKWNWNSIRQYRMNYGFNGRVRDAGFRWDGSYYYGIDYQELDLQNDFRFQDVFERISSGVQRFEWGDHVDTETYGYLVELLEYCKANRIEVVGIAPPFAPIVYDKMIASGKYKYLSEISPMCNELFAKYGYEYFDYMDGSILEVDDTYFIDGFHGGEVVYACILHDMIEKDSSISRYIDIGKLVTVIEKCDSSLLLDNSGHHN